MRIRFPGSLALAVFLAAAAPAPKPVITLDGITAAVKLDATARSAIAKQVAGLNAGLVRIVSMYRAYPTASTRQREQLQRDLKAVHERCLTLHNEIIQTLDPTQRTAFYEYLHAQMKAAGIDVEQMQRDMMGSDSTHDHGSMHDAMSGAGHGD